MPRASPRVLLIALGIAAHACAHDVAVRYPLPVDGPTGAVAFLFTRAASDVTVAVNGALVVRGAHTERVLIDHLPTGPVDVVIAVGPEEKAIKVWIDDGQTTTVPLGSPGVAPIDGWRAAFVSLASVVLYAVLR
jgi:hypothetical protein